MLYGIWTSSDLKHLSLEHRGVIITGQAADWDAFVMHTKGYCMSWSSIPCNESQHSGVKIHGWVAEEIPSWGVGLHMEWRRFREEQKSLAARFGKYIYEINKLIEFISNNYPERRTCRLLQLNFFTEEHFKIDRILCTPLSIALCK